MNSTRKEANWKYCHLCGRRLPFLIDRKDYVYKIGSNYYCSYTCYMKAKRAIEKEN